MTPRQLLAVSGLCLVIGGAAFPLGWWASHYLSDRMDNYDPRISHGKHGW
ncbi:hypothetical protein [Mycobacteroides franklinii]|nr:hypothetical protein [Mycobacteroides franklinii]